MSRFSAAVNHAKTAKERVTHAANVVRIRTADALDVRMIKKTMMLAQALVDSDGELPVPIIGWRKGTSVTVIPVNVGSLEESEDVLEGILATRAVTACCAATPIVIEDERHGIISCFVGPRAETIATVYEIGMDTDGDAVLHHTGMGASGIDVAGRTADIMRSSVNF